MSKYAFMPSAISAYFPFKGLVFDAMTPTWISLSVTPGACTGTFLVRSAFATVVAGPPAVPLLLSSSSPEFPQAPNAKISASVNAAVPVTRERIYPPGSSPAAGSRVGAVGPHSGPLAGC
jgi:hypothetical protein